MVGTDEHLDGSVHIKSYLSRHMYRFTTGIMRIWSGVNLDMSAQCRYFVVSLFLQTG